MKKLGFTLVEMIVVIVIMGILSAGTFVAIKHLYQRVAKSKALSELSFDSQVIVDQISALLYDRVPSRVWGYKNGGQNKTSIYDISDSNFTILEWYGTANEYLKEGNYSGFIDMDISDKDTKTIVTPGINLSNTDKFGSHNTYALAFAGSFDTGSVEYNATVNDGNITLSPRPNEIYEKYYLIDSAYAIARKSNITSTCSDVNQSDNNNTLYLFYNYHPWKNQTFCDGNVTILSKEAKGFQIGIVNDSIYFNLTLSRHIRGIDTNVTISKQKVVF